MNLDLKSAYELSNKFIQEKRDFSLRMLRELSAAVMKNTGSIYNTLQGSFDSSCGDFRGLNVNAGTGGRSYLSFLKIEDRLNKWCQEVNLRRNSFERGSLIYEKYLFTFEAHFDLITIHPWADGNGRTSRLVMNHLQNELELFPTKILKEDKAEYIQALIDSREQEDKAISSSFMMKNHIKNLKSEIFAFKKSRD
ncbi:Fic family protein [uncultured Turicimonas sp.]|uniref:Fic family protein n=1 Tax=uncultured Turicimonas sp. TaxID=1918607 RepID=UPI002804C174|nr:Fic family protein [uncultured Turicimonas sp.]